MQCTQVNGDVSHQKKQTATLPYSVDIVRYTMPPRAHTVSGHRGRTYLLYKILATHSYGGQISRIVPEKHARQTQRHYTL